MFRRYNTGVLIDTHCHLYFDRFDADRVEVLRRMREARVGGAVVIGIDQPTNAQALGLALRHPELRYSAGLHPTSEFPPQLFNAGGFDARAYLNEWLDCELKPVAIGECGIDLHWDANPLKQQQQVFHAQLELARGMDLPCIVHTRDANPETLEVLEQVEDTRGVLHCFNGSPELLEFALSERRRESWYVSFAGNLTFPKARELRDAAARVPLEQLLVETDAPFLAPQPHRGKRSEPADCRHTAQTLKEVKGIPLEQLEAQLYSNACRCFNTQW